MGVKCLPRAHVFEHRVLGWWKCLGGCGTFARQNLAEGIKSGGGRGALWVIANLNSPSTPCLLVSWDQNKQSRYFLRYVFPATMETIFPKHEAKQFLSSLSCFFSGIWTAIRKVSKPTHRHYAKFCEERWKRQHLPLQRGRKWIY